MEHKDTVDSLILADINKRLDAMGRAFLELKQLVTPPPPERKYRTELFTSPDIHELALSLAKARAEIKPIKSGTHGHFGYYASLDDIFPYVDPLLAKHGLSVTQIDTFNEFGNDILITILMHVSNQWIRSIWLLNTDNLERNKRAGDITYWRRYTYSALVGISSTEDDPDTSKPSPKGNAFK